jgi:hypothetical protein
MDTLTHPLTSNPWGIGLCALLEILLVLGVFAICVRTELVRDCNSALPDFRTRPFSLAKSQLAFWTVLVIGCFIEVFFTTGTFFNLINNTVLWLLGISTGTTALSAAADGGPPPPSGPQLHKRYFDDILSDTQGMNVHRLQMLLWTVVFGGIFVYETFSKHVFPDFDDNAFILMGISSITYVWLKRGEV